ncbi:MAG: NAD-dependent epimerase/dehydratase family protein [Planctomycetes bacterium]|nr:NAD-dependent epimerase/dehydratase family protein [Planctomycetota bacterium]
MKILITGGLGFIGSHLAKKYVEKGVDVTILSRSSNKIENIKDIRSKIHLILKDIIHINKEDVKDKDYIFHMAGSTDNYSIQNDPFLDINLNCNGTISLLENCRKHNKNTKIIFASTFFVNGNVTKLPVDSKSPCNPLGLYGATRLAAEHFCHIYSNVFGLKSIIARFTNVFGPFEQAKDKKKAGFNYLINQALNEKQINLYDNGNFYRDYIYVDDVVDACIMLADKGEINKTYYVGRGEFVKFRKLIDIIVSETQTNVTPIEPPEFHKKVGIKDFVCDNYDMKNIGWQPKISIEEGIRRTIDYYREQKDGTNRKSDT